MASVPYAITTTTKVKAQLNLTSTDANRDAFIDDLCSAVTDFIEAYCGGRRFMATDYIELYDTYNSNVLILRQPKVNSVSDVSYRTGLPSAPTWVTYYVNGYIVKAGAGIINFFSKFVAFPQAFRVTYNAGYLIDFTNFADPTKHNLPHDLTQVATELVTEMFNTRFSQGVVTETTEGQTIDYANIVKALDNNHKNVLKRYIISHFAP